MQPASGRSPPPSRRSRGPPQHPAADMMMYFWVGTASKGGHFPSLSAGVMLGVGVFSRRCCFPAELLAGRAFLLRPGARCPAACRLRCWRQAWHRGGTGQRQRQTGVPAWALQPHPCLRAPPDHRPASRPLPPSSTQCWLQAAAPSPAQGGRRLHRNTPLPPSPLSCAGLVSGGLWTLRWGATLGGAAGLWWQRGVQVMGLCGAAASLSRLGGLFRMGAHPGQPPRLYPKLEVGGQGFRDPRGDPEVPLRHRSPCSGGLEPAGPHGSVCLSPAEPGAGGTAGQEGWALRGLSLSPH